MQDEVPEEDMQQELMETIQKGNFTMRILYEQLGNILKMGPMGQMMNMIPGFSNSGLFTKVTVHPEYQLGMWPLCKIRDYSGHVATRADLTKNLTHAHLNSVIPA